MEMMIVVRHCGRCGGDGKVSFGGDHDSVAGFKSCEVCHGSGHLVFNRGDEIWYCRSFESATSERCDSCVPIENRHLYK